MFSKKSIRTNFLVQLSIAMAMLLIFFSTIIYSYINYIVDTRISENLLKQANYLFASYPNLEKDLPSKQEILRQTLNINVKIITLSNYKPITGKIIKSKNRHNQYFAEIFFPYKTKNAITTKYLNIKSNVTESREIQATISKILIFINLAGMVLIVIYAYFLSNMLLSPINTIKNRLAKMDENMLSSINEKLLPKEFYPVAKAINHLTRRIQNYIKYQKELFVGAAHELKTPLAVMKTKNQVTMIKKEQSIEHLREALKQNIITIDEMDKTISSILNFGREEGEHLRELQTIDIIQFLKNKVDGFVLLARKEQKKFTYHIEPSTLTIKTQPLLINQIVQNFVQNAIRFTPEGKSIRLHTKLQETHFIIEVIDEGVGIDENKDLFAPFSKSQNSSGVGLGLFLAQSAANSLEATISIKNKKGNNGVIATLILPT